MTEDRSYVSDWHAQFAPAPVNDCGTPVVETERQETVEHFAGEDGVFTAPAPVEATVDAPAEDAPKAKGKKGEAESAA